MRGWPWALAAAALAVVVHVDALGNELVFDDLALIQGNERIRSLARWREWLTTSYWGPGHADGLWRPLTLASFALNHACAGLAPAGLAAVNLALHALVAAGLVGWARSLGASAGAAGLLGLGFAVLPVHVEAVVGFVGRAELLCALGVVGALWAESAAARARDGRRRGLRALALVAGGAALLSKESAVVLPGLVLLQHGLRPAARASSDAPAEVRRARGASASRAALPHAALVLLYLGARWLVLGALGPDPATIAALDNPLVPPRTLASGTRYGVDALGRVAGALAILVEDLRLVLWPARLSCDWSLDATRVPRAGLDPRSAAGALLLAGSALAAWGARRSTPRATLGVLGAWLALLPASNLLVVSGTILAERLLYLPSAFFLLALLAGGERLVARAPRVRPLLVALALAAVAAGAWRSADRTRDWRDARSLWAAAVRAAPDSAKARREWAKLQWREGEARERAGDAAGARAARESALEHFERALELYPDERESLLHVADLARKLDRLERALEAQELALALDPSASSERVNLALLHVLLAERLEGSGARAHEREALALLDAVLAEEPRHVQALRARAGLLAERLGRTAEAARDLRRLAELLPPGEERERLERRARALSER